MKIINGTELYSNDGITVHQCNDCYIVSNGVQMRALSFMPQLNSRILAKMFSDSSSLRSLQYQKAVMKPLNWFERFNHWLNNMVQQSEMHTLGY